MDKVLGRSYNFEDPTYMAESWKYVQEQNKQGLLRNDMPKPTRDTQVATSPGMAQSEWRDHKLKQDKAAYAARDAEVRTGNNVVNRWKRSIDNMMASQNPALQKKAMEMVDQQWSRSAQNAESQRVRDNTQKTASISAHGKQAIDAGFIYGTPSYHKYVKGLNEKTKMFEHKMVAHGDRFQDANGKEVHVKAGTKVSDLGSMGDPNNPGLYPLKKDVAGDVGKITMIETAREQFPIIDKFLYGEDGEIDESIMRGMLAIEQLGGLGSFGVEKLGNPNAQRVYAAFETGMQAITRTETGAAMPPEEVDNTKKRFMPNWVDSKETRKQKIKAYRYFLDNSATALSKTVSAKEATKIVNGLVEKSFEATSSTKHSLVPGTIKTGKSGDYKYLGGDPKDPSSWEKQQ